MGLPEVNIIFKALASTAKTRSARGVVALIFNDSSVTGLHTYTKKTQLEETYSAEHLKLLKMCFDEYGVHKIMVASSSSIDSSLSLLADTKFDYLAVPYAATGDNAKVVTFINSQRDKKLKSKAILVKQDANHEAIINFTATGIKEGTASITPELFTVDIACVLATIPLDQSATYYVFSKVTGVDYKTNPDAAVDNGELFLINDGEKIKLSRAVNSLKTLTGEKKAPMKKIKVVEGMDLIKSDIMAVFENNYIGKVLNTYNNKVLFMSDINTVYLTNMAEQGVLNKDGTNAIAIDLATQETFIEEELEVDTTNMTDVQILHYNTGSNVFMTGAVSFADAIEDIALNLYY